MYTVGALAEWLTYRTEYLPVLLPIVIPGLRDQSLALTAVLTLKRSVTVAFAISVTFLNFKDYARVPILRLFYERHTVNRTRCCDARCSSYRTFKRTRVGLARSIYRQVKQLIVKHLIIIQK